MEEEKQKISITNNFDEGSNCQVFNGDITNSVFAMPGSTVNQYATPTTVDATGSNKSTSIHHVIVTAGIHVEICADCDELYPYRLFAVHVYVYVHCGARQVFNVWNSHSHALVLLKLDLYKNCTSS